MTKYYILLFLAFGLALFYIFLQDPCSNKLSADFSNQFPGYEILSSGAGETSTDTAQCHIRYRKPDNTQTYEDVWLYQDSEDGWKFSRVLETQKRVE